jgi:hypothetical protein
MSLVVVAAVAFVACALVALVGIALGFDLWPRARRSRTNDWRRR